MTYEVYAWETLFFQVRSEVCFLYFDSPEATSDLQINTVFAGKKS